MKKVLIVEDDSSWQQNYEYALKEKVLIIQAFDLDQARERFASNNDLDAIVMDACIGNHPNTYGITEEFRKTFKGPMIAASSARDYRKVLMSCGCDYEAPKDLVPQKLIEVLGI